MNRWHYRRSLASRVALLTVIAVGLSIAAMSFASYVLIRAQLQSTLDESLLNRANKAAQSDVLATITATPGVPSFVLGAADVRIYFVTADGRYRTVDKGAVLPFGAPEVRVAAGMDKNSVRTLVDEDGVPTRVATVQAGHSQALVLAQPLTSLHKDLRQLTQLMAFFGGLGVVAAAAAGWMVARNGLRPVRRLTAAVEQIARTEDLTPLAVEGDDEIARLAGAFNQMLASLAASRDRQRRLIADASHELRTPLTSLRTNLELLSQADRSGGLPHQARTELLDDVRAQIEELSALVGDLVELNRDEPMSHNVETLDLVDVVEAAISRVRRRAPGVTFDVDLAAWVVRGEPASLERAVTNLLDNAAKWSPEDGTITVTLGEGVLTVDDQGPGISEADLPHVFDRFYRSEESRAMPGSGLGLSIVRQVAERHAGAVRAGRSPAGGARMQLWLPAAGALAGSA